MRTLSLDLRERIVAAYDGRQGTREEVAERFGVSVGMVKKLLQQRRRTNDLGHRHRYSGRKARILPKYREGLLALVAAQPDLTLAQIREKLAMTCTVPAVHQALVALGLTYKRRRSMPPSNAGPMSPKHEGGGGPGKANSPPAVSSSSTKRRPRRT
jgi:transposase